MKVGILTFHNADNYGAVLQAYALQETLKTNLPNAEISIIDYRNTTIENSYKIIGKKKNIFSFAIQLFYVPFHIIKKRRFEFFRRKFFVLNKDLNTEYDYVVYGSDQIWNYTLTSNDLTYFGQNVTGKKIGYAVSDGGELYITEKVKELLNSFILINCREDSLKRKLCNENIKVPMNTVCDPVFLLGKDKWKTIAQVPKQKNYVLAYKVGYNENFDAEAIKLSEKLKLDLIQVVYVQSLRTYFFKTQTYLQAISPQKFLGLLISSSYIITTSFHATAFSLIFKKNFMVLKVEKRSERITDLLTSLGMLERYVSSVNDMNEIDTKYTEEYEIKLSKIIQESKAVLLNEIH